MYLGTLEFPWSAALSHLDAIELFKREVQLLDRARLGFMATRSHPSLLRDVITYEK